jgi:hypothetical protein
MGGGKGESAIIIIIIIVLLDALVNRDLRKEVNTNVYIK